jgi:pimeloyl-ACP methyl ester carboxylesterase
LDIVGHKTRVAERGEGEPVVVLHGWGGRIESMAPVIGCLASRFRVIAFDLPGFGESPPPEEGWGTAEYAEFVRGLLAELEIDGASFVGHSYGAKTSLYLAATHRDLPVRIVAVGSSGLRSAPSFRARAKRLVSKGARAAGRLGPPGRALRQAIYQRIASDDYKEAGRMRPTLVRVVNEDISGLLGSIKAPVLLVWGSEDDAAPLSHGVTMQRLIPDAGLVTFEGAGHFAYLDQPDRFCRIVRHFLGAPVE